MERGFDDLPRLALGPWTIDGAARRVDGPNGSVRLEPKAMGVLLELAKTPNEVVYRQHLLERVWGAEMATDDVLSRAISELRRALGDDARYPKFLETVRGSGYRLVVPAAVVEILESPPVSASFDRIRLSSPLVGTLAAIGATLVTVVALRSAEVDRRDSVVERPAIPVTTRPGQESAPRVSPDGTRIVYTWLDDATGTQQVYTRLLDGGADVRVTDGDGDYQLAAWSPDGSRLVVTRTDGSALGIYEIPSLGGGARLVAPVAGPYILGLDWAADGRFLVYSALDSSTMSFGVRVLDRTTQRERRLTTGARDAFGDVYPVFSPDGQQVAFVRFFSEVAGDVYVTSAGGGVVRRVTHDERAIGSLAFDRTGRALLYSSNRDGQTAVWRVSLDAADPRPTKVYASAHGITGLTAVPSGDGIVAAETDRDLNVWRAVLDGSDRTRQVIASTRLDALPRYSPNGSQIAFVSDRSGQSELWVSDSGGRNPVQLTRLGDVRGVPSWEPNGDRIAVEREARGRSELWVVDVARRTASPMATTLQGAVAPSWSADGRAIYVSSRVKGRWEIFSVAVDDVTVKQITSDGGMGARPGRDGRRIVFVKPYVRGLWMLDLATQVESLVTADLGAGDCTNWDLGPGGVTLVRRGDNGRQAIVLVPYGKAAGTVVARDVRVPVGTGGISVSPDGRSVLFGQADRRDGDLVMIRPSR